VQQAQGSRRHHRRSHPWIAWLIEPLVRDVLGEHLEMQLLIKIPVEFIPEQPGTYADRSNDAGSRSDE
jgi:hypothetical protein